MLAGDTDSFRPLVERYQDAVFGVALSKTGSFADADDIAQETFLAAFHSLGKLKDPLATSWLAEATGDEDRRVRLEAVRCLGAIGGDEATAAIIGALGDTDDAVGGEAVALLSGLGESVVAPLGASLEGATDLDAIDRALEKGGYGLGTRRTRLPGLLVEACSSARVS